MSDLLLSGVGAVSGDRWINRNISTSFVRRRRTANHPLLDDSDDGN